MSTCGERVEKMQARGRKGRLSRMNNQVYTHARWYVKEDRQDEFIAAWQSLGSIFGALPHPPVGKGVLVQSTSDPKLFYSFGPWQSVEHVENMRNDPDAQAGIHRLVELCTEASPGTFRVVAESP